MPFLSHGKSVYPCVYAAMLTVSILKVSHIIVTFCLCFAFHTYSDDS